MAVGYSRTDAARAATRQNLVGRVALRPAAPRSASQREARHLEIRTRLLPFSRGKQAGQAVASGAIICSQILTGYKFSGLTRIRRLRITKMKHIANILLIASTFIAADVRGQGFVYLSNTNQTVNSSDWTTGEIWIPFTTGANASSYLLDSVTVLFASNDNPVATTAAVFDYSSSSYTDFYSGIEIGSAGYYTFAPNTPISLAADSHYAILIFQSDALSSVTANWSFITSSAVTSVVDWSTSLTDGT